MHTTSNFSWLLFFDDKIDILKIKRQYARLNTVYNIPLKTIFKCAFYFFFELRIHLKLRLQKRNSQIYFFCPLQMKTQKDHLSLWMITIVFGKKASHTFIIHGVFQWFFPSSVFTIEKLPLSRVFWRDTKANLGL